MSRPGEIVLGAAVVLVGVRLYFRARKKRASGDAGAGPDRGRALGGWPGGLGGFRRATEAVTGVLLSGDMALVAAREVHERVRARAFRVVTLILLVTVAAVIVVPVLTKSHSSPASVGVVAAAGATSPAERAAIDAAARAARAKVRVVPERDLSAAKAALRSGAIDLVADGSSSLYVKTALSRAGTSTLAQIAQSLATTLGIDDAFRRAGVSPSQVAQIVHAEPVPVRSLQPAAPTRSNPARSGSAILGVVLIFVMLNQYNTWTLIGVMEEKSSRVVEVLLATVKPIQLLGGKVLGIGIVALAQALLVTGVGFALAAAMGSSVLNGATPLVLLASLAWLILGYAFYCWVFAGAGAMAERQDQVQTLALPLSIPMIVGYVVALTGAAGASGPSLLVKVFAYLPPTAPFAMPALVGAGEASWWEFVISALLSISSTFAVAHVAARVYRRAVLRTGRRVRLREVFGGL